MSVASEIRVAKGISSEIQAKTRKNIERNDYARAVKIFDFGLPLVCNRVERNVLSVFVKFKFKILNSQVENSQILRNFQSKIDF